jgi:hypothetical protein
LASPRRLHMSNLSKNNGFLEREFWQAIHFYRFVAPPCHQIGHQFLSLRLTKKRTRQDKPTQAWWIWGQHQTTNFSVYRCSYVVSKNINQRVQEATLNTHCDHERWYCKFFSPFHCKMYTLCEICIILKNA